MLQNLCTLAHLCAALFLSISFEDASAYSVQCTLWVAIHSTRSVWQGNCQTAAQASRIASSCRTVLLSSSPWCQAQRPPSRICWPCRFRCFCQVYVAPFGKLQRQRIHTICVDLCLCMSSECIPPSTCRTYPADRVGKTSVTDGCRTVHLTEPGMGSYCNELDKQGYHAEDSLILPLEMRSTH